MERLAELPGDMVFFTQITMEAAEDPEFLDAMRKARIKGALVGVEAVTAGRAEGGVQGLQLLWRQPGQTAADFPQHGVHVLGSFIFGLPTDRPDTFDATAALAKQAGPDVRAVRDDDAVSRARSIFGGGKRIRARTVSTVGGIPLTRYWLIPHGRSAEDVHAASQHERR